MHHFSQIEIAVTQTLFALDAAKPDGESLRLRHLIGQEYEDLEAAICRSGPFSNSGKSACDALSKYRTQCLWQQLSATDGRLGL